MRRLLTLALAPLFVLALALGSARGAGVGDLEFLEAFAWGDRSATLKELVPGTEDYYYFHGLHAQLAGDRAAFQRTMNEWLAKNRNTSGARIQELRRRQMLLDYDRTPDATWNYLRNDLGLTFNHRARDEERVARHPSVLRPEQYGVEVFMREGRAKGRAKESKRESKRGRSGRRAERAKGDARAEER